MRLPWVFGYLYIRRHCQSCVFDNAHAGHQIERDFILIPNHVIGRPRLSLGASVSIHAPARDATASSSPTCWSIRFQSTRPRGARRHCTVSKIRVNGVSIHAPARGATFDFCGQMYDIDVSIHAPARGATLGSAGLCGQRISFNPRAREGRDRHGQRRGCDAHAVSIHAPARGATYCPSKSLDKTSCFNPRAREGRDVVVVAVYLSNIGVSIHAPARGATVRHSMRLLVVCFNPRAREGRDNR